MVIVKCICCHNFCEQTLVFSKCCLLFSQISLLNQKSQTQIQYYDCTDILYSFGLWQKKRNIPKMTQNQIVKEMRLSDSTNKSCRKDIYTPTASVTRTTAVLGKEKKTDLQSDCFPSKTSQDHL